MEWIGIVIDLAILIFIVLKVSQIEVDIRSIAKNLEIMKQNQKVFFEEQLKDKKEDRKVLFFSRFFREMNNLVRIEN